jgi:sigma-B regulation protein RsbU (phosphoserine phosphatase)
LSLKKPRPYLKKLLRVFLTSILYILLFLCLYYLLYLVTGLRHPTVALFITLMITVYFHDETTWAIRNFIDRSFYRKIFSINRHLEAFNKEMNSTLDFQVLIQKFIEFLKNTFPENSWAFYFCWGEDFELFESNKISLELPKLVALPENRELDKVFPNRDEFYALEKIKNRYPAMKEALQYIPESEELHYYYPLNSYKGHVGFVIFDRKFNYYLHFRDLRRTIIRIFNKTADVLENDLLYSEVERKSLQNHLLLEIGKKISAILHLDEVLETIIDSISQLVNYNAGGIFLVDEKQNVLRRRVTRGYDEKLLDKLALKLDLGSYGWVVRNKKSSIVNDVKNDPYYYSVRETTQSQVTVPLLNGEDVVGVIALESDRINHFTPADLELLRTFASQAVIAIENAQLYEESLQKERLVSELVVASKVQKALLPEEPPDFPGYKISFANIASRIVGGDYYDIFRLSESRLGIAIGDVSGKGAPASILMAILYAGFRSIPKESSNISGVVSRLNNLMTEITTEGYYATFFFGIIEQVDHTITFTNAGHNPPMLIRRDGSVTQLEKGGIVLGFLKDQEYLQETVQLNKGDYLIFYTDGGTEVKNSEGEEFGTKRLSQFVTQRHGKAPQDIQEALLREIHKFSARKEMSDDVTIAIVYIE